jgi:hypothetical protein
MAATGKPVAVTAIGAARVDPELVAAIEEMLAAAKAGRVNGLFMVATTFTDGSLAVRHNAATHEMVGAVTIHRQLCIDTLLEDYRPTLGEGS